MKPPKPLPTEPPYLTFYTPTFRRPQGLARCMASIGRQTAVDRVEQIILPDHAGLGVAGGLFGRIPWYAGACRGTYVTIICDDDQLTGENVVAEFIKFAEKNGRPPVVVVGAIKNGFEYPSCDPVGEPLVSQVDLGCYILRQDIWWKYADDYGSRYEGDFDHAHKMWEDGIPFTFLDLNFVEGGATNGRPEVDW